MKTLTKGIEVKKALEIAKSFIAKKKDDSRILLKAALVTENHIIATDSRILIRLNHSENVQESYLHHYKKDTEDYTAENYPKVDRVIPDYLYANKEFKINIAEWMEAYKAASVAADEHHNKLTYLEGNKVHVPALQYKPEKGRKDSYSNILKKQGYRDVKISVYDQISFTSTLDTSTGIEKTAYNCDYMLTLLKAFKKMKETEVTAYYYGPRRPILVKSEHAEIILMPIAVY